MENQPAHAIRWDDAPVFLAVARLGTISAAALSLDMGVATVSRRLERLESALGQVLFLRHQSGYQLTPEGQALLPRAEALEAAMHGFRHREDPPGLVAGHVRLATAENLANDIIIPALQPLMERHPELRIDVLSDIATINLHAMQADLAVRMVRPARGNLKVQRIGTLAYGLYAGREYASTVQSGTELASDPFDRFIGWSEQHADLPAARWVQSRLQGREPVLRTSSLAGQLAAARAGIGAAVLPHFLGSRAALVRLDDIRELDQTMWLVVHSDLSETARLRVVADHLRSVVEGAAAELEGQMDPDE